MCEFWDTSKICQKVFNHLMGECFITVQSIMEIGEECNVSWCLCCMRVNGAGVCKVKKVIGSSSAFYVKIEYEIL